MGGKVRIVDDEVEVTYERPASWREEKVYATVDLLIPRPDLGFGATTFVRAGEQVPPPAVRFMALVEPGGE